MKIKVICQEGFSSEYTGGGSYIDGIYRYIPYEDYLKLENLTPPFYFVGSFIFYHLLNYIRTKNNIARGIKNIQKYDVIHNNNVIPIPKLKGATVVTTIHHLFFKMDLNSRIRLSDLDYIHFPTEALMVHNSDFLISVSELTKKKIIRYFSFPQEKIEVIPNGVNSEIFNLHDLPEKNFILFPNALRLPQRKGAYFILPVLKQILNEYKNLKCVITGPLSSNGKKIIDNLSNKFQHVGFVSEIELSHLYNQAMFVIFPSIYEGYGLVPLEVISSGGVILSTDVGAVTEYLKDGTNGFILPLNREKWLEIMRKLIEKPVLRENIRKNNRQKKIRSWEDCAEDHIKFFKKIIEER